uniref:Uncharacterized protein n=7 Tax=Vibrionaceae TaxID=641 RepID=A0A0H3ZWN8_9VIBR|nr:hypothetical protein [Vibrio splendidus]AKN36676.1 hypothetical protein [Vibrio sp. FF_482]AKN37850.1 hypothetical protein [Vibrio tasmaniensis]AKN38757.1 hypothetical protein [Enterovibrio norvegicus]AKN38943.1 hypothetical protein [Aliivibrio fischeri]AKN39146.1 hypothetical protein [Vibrio kanaloae]AKN39935.1 hypothetical protein [Vibrio sp. FF_307]
MGSRMIDLDSFEEIKDEFISCVEDGLTINDIADGFGFDRQDFSDFVESNSDALAAYRKGKFTFKRDLMKTAKTKGTVKAIQELIGDDSSKLSVEFKRGDMRTPDEIIITNTESHEKKSLESLLYSEACLKS